MRRKVVALGHSVEHQAKLYLDVNFWLMLRNAELGVRPSPDSLELLSILRAKVAKGIIFCPISESVYFEVIKQSDEKTRLATATLIDEFSRGIAITPIDIRSATELAYAFHVFQGSDGNTLDPLDTLVWTRVGHVIGMEPQLELGIELSPDDRCMIMKAMFDEMWSLSAHELITLTGKWNLPKPEGYEVLTQYINTGNANHAANVRSFQQAYNAELQGSIDFCVTLQPELMRKIAATLEERADQPTPTALDRSGAWRAAFARHMKRDDIKRILAMLHIQACLHASIRWDKRRKVESNDIYDFNHASDALPYCDAFFTEGPLHATLSAKHIALDKLYGCRVYSDPSQAIEYLKSLS
jgi:hypothetical protein